MMTDYSIYMLKSVTECLVKRFESHAWAETHGGFRQEDYELVYTGRVMMTGNVAGVLDGLFALHNKRLATYEPMHMPRSVSVSDVIVLNGTAWYCDPIGWKKLGENEWNRNDNIVEVEK